MAITFGGSGTGSPSPFYNTSESHSSGTPITIASMGDQYKQYQNIFGKAPTIDISKIPRVGTIPSITAPRITPAVVATPAQLEQRVASIYAPRYAELSRQQTLQDRALQGAAAAAGLGDSGVAIGAQQIQGEAFGRERAALEGAQAGQRLDIETNILMQNAANRQAASLAQAQIDVGAATANAQAILAGRTADAENYLKAIGLNSQIADSYRNGFLNFFNTEQQLNMQRDQISSQFNGQLLDAMLKQAGIEQNAQQFAATQQMEQQKIDVARGAPTGEFGYNPYAQGTGAVTMDARGFPVYSGTAAGRATGGQNLFNMATMPQPSTLGLTSRIFGGAPRSLGIGGI